MLTMAKENLKAIIRLRIYSLQWWNCKWLEIAKLDIRNHMYSSEMLNQRGSWLNPSWITLIIIINIIHVSDSHWKLYFHQSLFSTILLGVMTMKGYSTLPKFSSPKQEPHHQMQFSVITSFFFCFVFLVGGSYRGLAGNIV